MRMRSASAVLALLLAVSSAAVAADARVAFLAKQLKEGTDPRARVVGALGLGASHQAAAVKPLCAALVDPEETVRLAVVKALGELALPEALSCLKAPGEQPAAVAEALGAVVEEAEAGAGKKKALYVLMAPAVNQSGTLDAKLLRLAERKLRVRLAALGAVFVPGEESPEAAKKVLKARKLKGFYLLVHLEPSPGDGLLISVACSTYPGKNLLGAVKVSATGAGPEDLVEALAPGAVDEAAETFNWSK